MSKGDKCVVIGVCGPSGSGKSLLSRNVSQELAYDFDDSQIVVISEDCYYKDMSHLPMEERSKSNLDHPNAIDHALLATHLEQLKAGGSIEKPVYCFETYTRAKETVHVSPKKIVIVEGILLLADALLRAELDICIYMETPLDICFIRRLKKDVQKYGRTMEQVLERYQESVRPMFVEFVEPSKIYADIIIPRGGRNRVAIEMVKAKIHSLLMETV
jgi:uridine kinase